jgi:hypothetical protein
MKPDEKSQQEPKEEKPVLRDLDHAVGGGAKAEEMIRGGLDAKKKKR